MLSALNNQVCQGLNAYPTPRSLMYLQLKQPRCGTVVAVKLINLEDRMEDYGERCREQLNDEGGSHEERGRQHIVIDLSGREAARIFSPSSLPMLSCPCPQAMSTTIPTSTASLLRFKAT